MGTPNYNTYSMPDCKSLVVVGDIHGDFEGLVNKVCKERLMRDTLVIVAGDCGFGFKPKAYFDDFAMSNASLMEEANNSLLFVRGNHDNPAYFDGITFCHPHFIAIPDYSVVKACDHTILCVGGAISVDRHFRIDAHGFNTRSDSQHHDPLAPNLYWKDEAPLYRNTLLTHIVESHTIDTIVTHSAPSFCQLHHKDGIEQWAIFDRRILDDVQDERCVMDKIYDFLTEHHQPISHWCYGHFHQSWHNSVEGCQFRMLDIMELFKL